MKYRSIRYTFGIILGAISVVVNITFLTLESITLGQLNNIEDPELKSKTKSSSIRGVIICAASLIISAVFIYGIVKRKHKLIDPWMVFCSAVLVGSLKVIIAKSIAIGNGTETGSQNVTPIGMCILIIVMDVLIIWFSYTIYKKIRSENRGKLTNITAGEESPSTEYTPIPDKT